MFRCNDCRRVTEPGEKTTKVGIAFREKEYTDERGRLVGRGYEAAREVDVCPDCAPQHEPKPNVRILPTYLVRDKDGRVRLNTEQQP
jgi:hypothetical protein